MTSQPLDVENSSVSAETRPEAEERTLRHLWKKGQSGNPNGRPKGVPNKASIEVKEFCRGVLTSKAYRASLRSRIQDGKLPPNIEALLFFYAYGKPKETLELEGSAATLNVLAVLGEVAPEVLRGLRQAMQARLTQGDEEQA